jgi:hypothetical protein
MADGRWGPPPRRCLPPPPPADRLPHFYNSSTAESPSPYARRLRHPSSLAPCQPLALLHQWPARCTPRCRCTKHPHLRPSALAPHESTPLLWPSNSARVLGPEPSLVPVAMWPAARRPQPTPTMRPPARPVPRRSAVHLAFCLLVVSHSVRAACVSCDKSTPILRGTAVRHAGGRSAERAVRQNFK